MDIYLLRCPSLKFLRDVSEFILFLEINYKLVFPVFSFQPSVFLRFRFYNSELWLPPPHAPPPAPFLKPNTKDCLPLVPEMQGFLANGKHLRMPELAYAFQVRKLFFIPLLSQNDSRSVSILIGLPASSPYIDSPPQESTIPFLLFPSTSQQ